MHKIHAAVGFPRDSDKHPAGTGTTDVDVYLFVIFNFYLISFIQIPSLHYSIYRYLKTTVIVTESGDVSFYYLKYL